VWIDQYTGKSWKVTTEGACGTKEAARVKTYGDVLREYEFHAEAKCADASGAPSTKRSMGLLARRHVLIEQMRYIGKESNTLEEVVEGLPTQRESPYTQYSDPRRDAWAFEVLPKLKAMRVQDLCNASGLNRSTIQKIRRGQKPHSKNQELLVRIVNRSTLGSNR
jgi:hypothetical protein